MIQTGNWSKPAFQIDWPAATPRFHILVCFAAALALGACDDGVEPEQDPRRVLTKASFDDLDGWQNDDPTKAVAAFLRSCERIASADRNEPLAGHDIAGPIGLWQEICLAAADQPALQSDAASARGFFEAHFQPYHVLNHDDPKGLFTGYFEPELAGSLSQSDAYSVPLFRLPDDLVTIELGLFSDEWQGRRVTGRVENNKVVPYYSRAEIDAGKLDGQRLEILWVDDIIEKFFLQIQGSGRVRLDDGRIVRVGYAGQNGHPYRAIGRDLIEMGEVSREAMSLQAIDNWLRTNPNQADALMHKNPSYIFFQLQSMIGPDDGPLGAQSVPLTSGRSLAVDRAFMPLGAPIWLDATMPTETGEEPLQRLFIAQDTGGAIKGPVRGDVFFGGGEAAKFSAGNMKAEGEYYLFLPKAMAEQS